MGVVAASPDIKQGEIFWVDIPPAHTVGSEQYDRRPYVVVSRTLVNRSGKTVVGVPLTTANAMEISQPPYRVVIPARDIIRDVSFQGEIKNSLAKTDHVRVLAKERLDRRMGKLSDTACAAVVLGLAFLFDR
jgi:mRNA-degrading endonuclease toxin of MazEF toxin-antitoxin module